MKIRKLQLKNIGVFDDETIEFQPCPVKDKAEIHIFTGQNGSGKSTLLMALASSFDSFQFTSIKKLSNDFQKRFRSTKNDKAAFTVFFSLDENSQQYSSFSITENHNYQLAKTPSKRLPLLLRTYVHWKNLVLRDSTMDLIGLSFSVFAFSGYRHLSSERVEAIYEPREFNPLSQSLEFIKDYSQPNQLTINQLITNNISKSAIERGRNKNKSEKFANVIKSIEQAISDITGWKVEFDLETEPTNLITKVNGEELEFDILPDGLRSLISWIADLLGRVDMLKWQDDLPIFEKNLILLLDEIEVHLHPAWQRKVLPVVQKLFKNSQIFVSTHSPFVVNSIDNAWVYELKVENGKAKVTEKSLKKTAYSYQTVLREVFDIDERFGEGTEKKGTQLQLDEFYKQRDAILKKNGKSRISKKKFLEFAENLASQSAELQSLVFLELARLSKEKGEPYEI
jgi:predicted ATP-binding protein involved in virulence